MQTVAFIPTSIEIKSLFILLRVMVCNLQISGFLLCIYTHHSDIPPTGKSCPHKFVKCRYIFSVWCLAVKLSRNPSGYWLNSDSRVYASGLFGWCSETAVDQRELSVHLKQTPNPNIHRSLTLIIHLYL